MFQYLFEILKTVEARLIGDMIVAIARKWLDGKK